MTIGKISIRPTRHYVTEHSDVDWETVVRTVLSPTKVHPNKRHGKNRWTYIKAFNESIVEVHVERDNVEEIIWVINAFKAER